MTEDPRMKPLILVADVDYETEGRARVGGLLFSGWEAETPDEQYFLELPVPAAYESGSFYKRELPCILELWRQADPTPEVLLIDGYVWLGRGQPGLGGHLYTALEGKVTVVGIAKNPYSGNEEAIHVHRGESDRPLFVTAAGIRPEEAAKCVERMHGSYRWPTLVKKVDRLCRDGQGEL